MRVFTFVMVTLCMFVGTASGVLLPEKWDRLTCKVVTDTIQGTGFLLRYEGKVFIVTNKHLVEPGKTTFTIDPRFVSQDSINSKTSETGKIIPSTNMYFWDEQYDLAFVHISEYAPLLDITIISESIIGGDSAIVMGQDVFFLGYPDGLHGHKPNTPLVRSGIIAGESEHAIILDGNVFGGSSGSPVFLSPSRSKGQLNACLLIGVISQLKTAPTKSHRQVLENMGIGYAIKMRYVQNTIRKWLDSR